MPRTDVDDQDQRFDLAIEAIHDEDDAPPPNLEGFEGTPVAGRTEGTAAADETALVAQQADPSKVTAQQPEPWRVQMTDMETRLRLERERDELRRRVEAFEREQAQKQQAKEPEKAPDFYSDPEGYFRHQREQDDRRYQERLQNQQVQFQQHMHFLARQQAEAQHTPQKVGEALSAIQDAERTGQIPAYEAHRIMQSPNPFHEVVLWHRNQQIQREVGPDLDAFRKRTREESLSDPEFVAQLANDPAFQARAIAAARGQPLAAVPAQAKAPSKPALPPSIAKTGTAAPAAMPADETDDERFEKFFARR